METVKLGLLIKKTKVARCGKHSYPVLSITKQNGIIMQSEKFKKRIASADTSDYKIIPRGKLVQGIHIDEGNFGIQDIVDNGIVSPAYGVWDVNDGLVIPKYLEMVLRSPKSIEFYRSKLTGTVNRRGHMSDTDFLSMDIPLPDRDTQSEILKTMKQTTSILCFRQQQLAKLDELIKARFIELFGNPVFNDKGWEQKPLVMITSKIGSGATPKGGKDAYQEDGITLVRSMNVHNGRFEYKDLAHISDEQAEKLDNVTLEENDVLLNITGASVARSCVVPGGILPARVNQHVCIIRCKESIVPEFLNKLLINDNYQVLLRRMAGAGATREAITKQQVENLHIIMPPLEIQQQFADFVVQTNKSKAAVQKSLDETQVLFDSLMQKYFG